MPSPMSPETVTESDDEGPLSRVTVLVGDQGLDVGLPSHVSVSALVDDVVSLAVENQRSRSTFPSPEVQIAGGWTLATVASGPVDPSWSLADAGVADGELLLLHELGAPFTPALVDELDPDGVRGGASSRLRWFAERSSSAVWYFAAVVMAVATVSFAALGFPGSPVGRPVIAFLLLFVGAGCALVSWMPSRKPERAAHASWVISMCLLFVFAGTALLAPEGDGAATLLTAMAPVGVIALLQLLVSGRGRSLHTAIVAFTALGTPALLWFVLSHPSLPAVGAVSATAAVIAVYLAPRITIGLSRLPLPRVPTAGEPLDDIETMGGTTVEGVTAVGKQVVPTEEGMTTRVRRASAYLTGIIAAAASLAVIGCAMAVGTSPTFSWRETVFAIVVASVLCLRGRGHHDLMQSAVLVGSGLCIALITIVRTGTFVNGWQVNSAVALVGVVALSMACGLVAPVSQSSPVMRRWVEILEYVAVALVFPLACSIIGIYGYFRGLSL